MKNPTEIPALQDAEQAAGTRQQSTDGGNGNKAAPHSETVAEHMPPTQGESAEYLAPSTPLPAHDALVDTLRERAERLYDGASADDQTLAGIAGELSAAADAIEARDRDLEQQKAWATHLLKRATDATLLKREAEALAERLRLVLVELVTAHDIARQPIKIPPGQAFVMLTIPSPESLRLYAAWSAVRAEAAIVRLRD